MLSKQQITTMAKAKQLQSIVRDAKLILVHDDIWSDGVMVMWGGMSAKVRELAREKSFPMKDESAAMVKGVMTENGQRIFPTGMVQHDRFPNPVVVFNNGMQLDARLLVTILKRGAKHIDPVYEVVDMGMARAVLVRNGEWDCLGMLAELKLPEDWLASDLKIEWSLANFEDPTGDQVQ